MLSATIAPGLFADRSAQSQAAELRYFDPASEQAKDARGTVGSAATRTENANRKDDRLINIAGNGRIHATDKIGALLPASMIHKPQPGDSETEQALPVATPGTPARSRALCAQERAWISCAARSRPDWRRRQGKRAPVEMHECNVLKGRSELALIWHRSRLTQGDDAGGRP
jgi:hypothetical protein